MSGNKMLRKRLMVGYVARGKIETLSSIVCSSIILIKLAICFR